jgi:outer membrane lipoprotein-sorting protein
MMKKLWLCAACISLPTLLSFRLAPLNTVNKIYAELETRQLKDGKYITVKGEICYEGNGNMVSHYFYPKDYVLLSNNKGEVKLYEPSSNTVVLTQNNAFSSQTSEFYYFFAGKLADMGLSDIGYVQEKVYPEKDLMVSLWKLKKPDAKRQVQKIKLVHQRQSPVYMHYEDGKGAIVRKVYYYGYTQLQDVSFPATSTEVMFSGKDSSVTKSVFRNFRLNEQATSQYFNYKIPSNAKIQRL